MNLLEQYIKKIHTVEPHKEEWTKDFPNKKFVEVDVTTNCYGVVERKKRVFETDEWKRAKEQGYWMA